MKAIDLPIAYTKRMQALLGSEYDDYLASFEQPSSRGLRVNTLKLNAGDFPTLCGRSLRPVPWIFNGFYAPEDWQASRDPLYYAGLFYLQEPSAMTPASCLPVEPGDRVLDLCAAPGGKATELGARLRGRGLLWANDISASRARALLKNLELWGISNICVTGETPERLSQALPEFFDKILVDAPCSGEGMFRRQPDMLRDWTAKGPAYYVPIQRELLLQAASMLRPGGYLLYSTCTFSPEEDEENVAFLLENVPEMSLVPLPLFAGAAPGFGLSGVLRLFPHRLEVEGHFVALFQKERGSRNEAFGLYEKAEGWEPAGKELKKDLTFAQRERPGKAGKARKNGEPEKAGKGKSRISRMTRRDGNTVREEAGAVDENEAKESYYAFARFLRPTADSKEEMPGSHELAGKQDALDSQKASGNQNAPDSQNALDSQKALDSHEPLWASGTIKLIGENLYALPGELPDTSGLRVLRSGLLLGQSRRGRFEPSQALAMALKPEEFSASICLSRQDERVLRYLKGESISSEPGILLKSGILPNPGISADPTESADGWRLICLEGFPLGWAKDSGALLKNKYYPGWRYT